ncbi:MAG: cysteine hydrolase [Comamonadaceae bacterium]|nr:cysteine hydrolase [Comamonadaceae bacterium]
MHATTELLIVDPQNDFCDLPAAWRPVDPASRLATTPALPVDGAHADMLRLAAFVDSRLDTIDAITVTLDSHRSVDIAHPPFWQTGAGDEVAPFTSITAAQVRAGEFRTRDPAAATRALDYLDALQARARYTLVVWPAHCLVGSWGHAIHAGLSGALGRWEGARRRPARSVFKGLNPWTEHYSAFEAEVPDPADPATALNRPLLDALGGASRLLVAGEASSHCVRATVEHLVQHLGPDGAGRVVLLTDCMSPVPGFDGAHAAFFADMARRGVRLSRSTEV